jgi:hypothetical protein
MAISVFPAPAAASGSSATTFAATLTQLGTIYEHEQSFSTGVYTVTVTPSTTNARLTFVSGSTIITSQDTTSGSVSFNLATAATGVFIVGQTTGTVGAVVQIEKTADPLTSDDIGNGTLDTINVTSTYNQTGLLGVLVIGGGAGGARGYVVNPSLNYGQGGAGGRAGFINGGMVVTNGPTSVTVGAKGTGETRAAAGTAPGNSSFGNLIVANAASTLFANASGGPGTADTGSGNAGPSGGTSGVFFSWNGNGTTGGGGGGGGQYNNAGIGGGSGIGTGGNSGSNGARGNDGTGKGSGGGGGRGRRSNDDISMDAGSGADGVVYVLRGF